MPDTRTTDPVRHAAATAAQALADDLGGLTARLVGDGPLDPAGLAALLIEVRRTARRLDRLRVGLTAPRPATTGRTGR